MLTKFEVTQNELEYAIYQFNKTYKTSENFKNMVDSDSEREEQARLEKLQLAVITSLCNANNWKLNWFNKVYNLRRSHKDRVIGIYGIPYYMRFSISQYPITERSRISISVDRLNWCKDNNINTVIFGIYNPNEECFYFGKLDIDEIKEIGELHKAGTKRNKHTDFFRDTYIINSLNLNELSFEKKKLVV